MASNTHIAYRPDIDGLRAVAVMVVVAFHAFPERLPGGFVGVDVFFVISGFLISSIIMQSIDRGVFSYRDFYARRIRRIVPALVAVLLATLALGWLLLQPNQNVPLSKEVIAGALFFYNFLLLENVGYFEVVGTQMPILHLWSLCVEEQFYIFWPVITGLIWRLRRGRLLVIAAIALASFALNISLIARYPSAAFYLPFTRFWQLLVGGILAAVAVRGELSLSGFNTRANIKAMSPGQIRLASNACSLLGFALIGGAVFALKDGMRYPGWLALVPTIGAAFLISAGPSGWVNRHILSRPAVVFVGLISYPLYLWHWPALQWAQVITKYFDPSAFTALVIHATQFSGSENSKKIAEWVVLRGPKTVALLVSLLLAVATYLVLEKRVKTSGNLKKTTWGLFIALVVVVPIFAAVQMTVMQHKMAGDGRSQFLRKFDMTSPDSSYRRATVVAYRPECSFYGGPGDVKPALAEPCYIPRARPVVMLWGDSHAMHLRPGLDAFQVKQKDVGKPFEVLQVTSGSCHAALKLSERNTDEAKGCNLATALALKTIAEVKPDVLVIAQAIGHPSTNWSQLLVEAVRLGARHVIVVGPMPQWTDGLPQLVAYQYWPEPPARLKAHLQPWIFAVDKQLEREITNTTTVSYVSAINFFCDQTQACMVSVGSDRRALTSHDSGHLTPQASEVFVEGQLGAVILRGIVN